MLPFVFEAVQRIEQRNMDEAEMMAQIPKRNQVDQHALAQEQRFNQ
jgi:hypothetical protein